MQTALDPAATILNKAPNTQAIYFPPKICFQYIPDALASFVIIFKNTLLYVLPFLLLILETETFPPSDPLRIYKVDYSIENVEH